MLRNILIGVALLSITYSCLEPYSLHIDGYDNLLVVDALITDENTPHTVVLRRSVSDINESSPYESGAVVYVTDANGANYYFAEFEPGTYQSDSTEFVANEGDKFVLHIQTADGEEYESDECELLPKTSIDKVYYGKNTKWDTSGETQNDGLSIYVDGSADESAYIRWIFEEDWKFRIPYPEQFIYDEEEEIKEIPRENEVCWKTNKSNDINLYSFANQVGGKIEKKEVTFIPTGLSDKLTMRYSILIKQVTISKEEYEYWRKLSESTEDVGDVFGKQPFSLTGNIVNTKDTSEPVLGFFQVGSIQTKRIYINSSVISDLKLPLIDYRKGCYVDTVRVDGLRYSSGFEIYDEYVNKEGMTVYQPLYGSDGMSIEGLLLAFPVCANCTYSGNINPPAFWEE